MKLPAAALLLALAATGAQAACSRELRIGVSSLGYAAYQQDGQMRGIIPDLVAALAQRSGCRLRLALRPRARVMLEFEQGQLDIVTSSIRTPERDRFGHFLPYAYAELDLLLLNETLPRTMRDLSQRPEFKLGLVRGVRLGDVLTDWVEPMLASKQAEYSPDFENLAAKLSAGRIQAALIPSIIHTKMRRDGLLPVQATAVDLTDAPPETIGLYVNRKNVPDADLQLLQRHVEALRREGQVQQVYARHIGEADARRLFRSEPAAR
ncbi:substrate-binding periplasmic protein [Roseateles sp. LYH14W]|uniref:Substrate-binding periplasmic protein n=1 Tax=Pelomonas parva TaxID=3299032 RepID=A0ABW7F8J8_9BURK